MPVLVFRQQTSASLGRIADALDLRGIEWQYVDLWAAPEPELSIETAQALVSLGGDMSVNDPLPWLREQERYIIRAISSGVPVLGVCLGAQLLAKCLGARVYPMGHTEIGWCALRYSPAASTDPLFASRPAEEPVFHWHGETFDLPSGAEHLAASDLCANQAFRWGSNVYGVQFHPEVTPEMIAAWGGANPHAHQQSAQEFAEQVFGRWCDLLV